jgi:hypothetical protein
MIVVPTPESGTIKEIAYDAASERLRVTFLRNGEPTYEYQKVSPQLWEEFSTSESKGKFFQAFIRPVYSGAMLQPKEK